MRPKKVLLWCRGTCTGAGTFKHKWSLLLPNLSSTSYLRQTAHLSHHLFASASALAACVWDNGGDVVAMGRHFSRFLFILHFNAKASFYGCCALLTSSAPLLASFYFCIAFAGKLYCFGGWSTRFNLLLYHQYNITLKTFLSCTGEYVF